MPPLAQLIPIPASQLVFNHVMYYRWVFKEILLLMDFIISYDWKQWKQFLLLAPPPVQVETFSHSSVDLGSFSCFCHIYNPNLEIWTVESVGVGWADNALCCRTLFFFIFLFVKRLCLCDAAWIFGAIVLQDGFLIWRLMMVEENSNGRSWIEILQIQRSQKETLHPDRHVSLYNADMRIEQFNVN